MSAARLRDVGKLAVLVPSRGRPHNLDRLAEAMDRTCRADTTLVVGLDADDDTLDGYQGLDLGPKVRLVESDGYRGRLVAYLNDLAGLYATTHDFLGHFGDDCIPRTDGWDVQVCESLERHVVCYGDDLDPGRPPGSLSLHGFMRASVVEDLGYMAVPTLKHMYPEVAWFAWGRRTSIEFLDGVVLEHAHYMVGGKAPADESYRVSTAKIPEDCNAYNDYCWSGRLNEDIERLGGKPFAADELRAFNRELNIPLHWGGPLP